MNFEPTAAQALVLEQVDNICLQHCTAEQERQREVSPTFPKMLLEALGRAGLLTLWVNPTEKAGFMNACLVQEKLASFSATAASLLFVNNAATSIMKKGGLHADCQNIFNEAASGQSSFSFAMTEANAGSDVSGLTTSAVSNENDYIINGVKSYATGSWDADYILVVARTKEEGPAKSGSSIILVPGDAKGLSKRKLPKPAGNAHATCELTFENVTVPKTHLIGEENAGWRLLYFGGLVERLLVAAVSVGLTQRALTEITQYLNQREQFGQPISRFQAIQHCLADFATELEAMRWLTRHAAWRADEDQNSSLYINMAKLHCSETGQRLITEAMRLSGGRGYFLDDKFNQLWREASLPLFAGGTSEVQRNGIARGLGL